VVLTRLPESAARLPALSRDAMLRCVLAAGCLLTFLGFEIAQFPYSRLFGEWAQFRQGLALSTTEARLRTSFGFDPDYGLFLEGVRSATPAGATIALDLPKNQRHALHTYQAWYTFAPRRIVGLDRVEFADYLAVYRSKRSSDDPTVVTVPFGIVIRRR
jgi:hypothetical protein